MFYDRVPQIFPWRSNLLQSLAPTLIKLTYLWFSNDLISIIRCVWLGLELNSAVMVQIRGSLFYKNKKCMHVWNIIYIFALTIPLKLESFVFNYST